MNNFFHIIIYYPHQNIQITPNSGVKLNKEIDVYFDLTQISIFDKQTELRL